MKSLIEGVAVALLAAAIWSFRIQIAVGLQRVIARLDALLEFIIEHWKKGGKIVVWFDTVAKRLTYTVGGTRSSIA